MVQMLALQIMNTKMYSKIWIYCTILRIAGAGNPEIVEQLSLVLTIVSDHFTHEENKMLAKNFPGYVAHKAEHFDLIATCKALQLKIEAGDLELTERICQLIKSWFDSHIPEYDRAYAQTLNSPTLPAKLVAWYCDDCYAPVKKLAGTHLLCRGESITFFSFKESTNKFAPTYLPTYLPTYTVLILIVCVVTHLLTIFTAFVYPQQLGKNNEW